MTGVLLGAIGLVVLILLARGYTRMDTHALAQGIRAAIILAAIAGAVVLLATGKFGFVILPLGVLAAVFAQNARARRQSGEQAQAGAGAGDSGGTRTAPGGMSRAEAFKVLGLKEGASEEEILTAYRRLIMQNHPDHGGSTYLAAKINQAKDVLLGK